MPTPSTGAISFLNIKDNFTGLTNYDGFAWGTNLANLYNLNYYRGRSYLKGGSYYTFSSGAISFNDFYNSSGNCQCACSTDSNCLCVCDCCFPGDAVITMADGTKKRIDQIRIGDVVDGGYGYKNTVEAYHIIKVGAAQIYIINGKHRTSVEHKHWTTEGWAAIEIYAATSATALDVVIDNEGNTEKRKNTKLERTKTRSLRVGIVRRSGSFLLPLLRLQQRFRYDNVR